jgi:hypothetical protein
VEGGTAESAIGGDGLAECLEDVAKYVEDLVGWEMKGRIGVVRNRCAQRFVLGSVLLEVIMKMNECLTLMPWLLKAIQQTWEHLGNFAIEVSFGLCSLLVKPPGHSLLSLLRNITKFSRKMKG